MHWIFSFTMYINKRVYTAKFLCPSLFVVVLATQLSNSYADNPNVRSYDPLHADEIDYVIAKFKQRISQDRNEQIRSSTSNTQGPIEQETFNREEPLKLLVERRPREKNSNSDARQANVYYYDYSTDELIHSIIDVNSGDIIRQDRLKNTQLPLIPEEIQEAFDIVTSVPIYNNALHRAYKNVTGQNLNDFSDINYKAIIFLADTLKNGLNTASKACGLRRCAQLLIYTKENISLDFSPIIDLSRGIVTQNPDELANGNSILNPLPQNVPGQIHGDHSHVH